MRFSCFCWLVVGDAWCNVPPQSLISRWKPLQMGGGPWKIGEFPHVWLEISYFWDKLPWNLTWDELPWTRPPNISADDPWFRIPDPAKVQCFRDYIWYITETIHPIWHVESHPMFFTKHLVLGVFWFLDACEVPHTPLELFYLRPRCTKGGKPCRRDLVGPTLLQVRGKLRQGQGKVQLLATWPSSTGLCGSWWANELLIDIHIFSY